VTWLTVLMCVSTTTQQSRRGSSSCGPGWPEQQVGRPPLDRHLEVCLNRRHFVLHYQLLHGGAHRCPLQLLAKQPRGNFCLFLSSTIEKWKFCLLLCPCKKRIIVSM
jgi:hypothetical protein